MMRKAKLIFLVVMVLATANIFSFSIYAQETVNIERDIITVDNEDSVGLIMYYGLSISAGTRSIYITSNTTATATMAKVGFTDISIQRSSNGVSGWTEEKPWPDDLANNSNDHDKISEYVPVTGGYYYRVVLDHYAKEKGLLFPSHENITNYSNVVWVPA
jgi:hemerythrin superfamily protein